MSILMVAMTASVGMGSVLSQTTSPCRVVSENMKMPGIAAAMHVLFVCRSV